MPTTPEETRAVATEIHRLAKLRIDGSTRYDPSEFCAHLDRHPGDRTGLATRLKLECVPCIAEIISGEFARRGH